MKKINGNAAALVSPALAIDVWIFATRGFKMSELQTRMLKHVCNCVYPQRSTLLF